MNPSIWNTGGGLDDDTRNQLASAWAGWDELPGDPIRAGRMEAACRCAAEKLGMPTTAFRRQLMACRCSGATYYDAVATLDNCTPYDPERRAA